MSGSSSSGVLLMTPAQAAVAARVVREESSKRQHVVVYLSGAHAYGFPSPDSDLDLKAIHAAPTSALVRLSLPTLTFDRMEVLDGVEVDYTSNEIGPALAGIVLGNGNFLERVLGSAAVEGSPWLAPLRPLVQRTLSRRVHRHYRGFGRSQSKALESSPSAKKALYVLRTTLTGTHLLRAGELETNVTKLGALYGLAGVPALVETKRAGEQTALGPEAMATVLPELARAFALLDAALEESVLPEEPPASAIADLEEWLVALRRELF